MYEVGGENWKNKQKKNKTTVSDCFDTGGSMVGDRQAASENQSFTFRVSDVLKTKTKKEKKKKKIRSNEARTCR